MRVGVLDIVFLDANVLFSASYRMDSSFRQLWSLDDARLDTSTYVLDEVLRNIHRDDHRGEVLRLVAAMTVHESLQPDERVLPAGLDLPAKDVQVLCDAIQAGSTHLLTGDRHHFGRYFGQTIGAVVILHPRDYLQLEKRSPGSVD